MASSDITPDWLTEAMACLEAGYPAPCSLAPSPYVITCILCFQGPFDVAPSKITPDWLTEAMARRDAGKLDDTKTLSVVNLIKRQLSSKEKVCRQHNYVPANILYEVPKISVIQIDIRAR